MREEGEKKYDEPLEHVKRSFGTIIDGKTI